MKSFLSGVLALAMGLLLSVPAAAVDTNLTTNGDYSIALTGTGTPDGIVSTKTISVDIFWDAMNFTYDDGNLGTWDEVNHTYTGAVAAGWQNEKKTITIRNNSNIKIEVGFRFVSWFDVTGSFTETELALESADAEQYRTPIDGVYPAPTASTQFGIDSTSGAVPANLDIGRITVTIQACNPNWSFSCAGVSNEALRIALSGALAEGRTNLMLNNINESLVQYAMGILPTLTYDLPNGSIELTATGVTRLNSGVGCGVPALKRLCLPDVSWIGGPLFSAESTSLKTLELTTQDGLMGSLDAFDGIDTTKIDLVLHSRQTGIVSGNTLCFQIEGGSIDVPFKSITFVGN